MAKASLTYYYSTMLHNKKLDFSNIDIEKIEFKEQHALE